VSRTTLERIEVYYDSVPRAASRAEDHGPLTLFVNQGAGWSYYARPRRGWQGTVEPEHVRSVRARQRALGLPESFEWVAEVTPGLADAARAAGLHVHAHALLVLDAAGWRPAPAPPGVEVRVVPSGAPDLASLRAVASLAFAEPGTAVGPAGRPELLLETAAVSAASVTDLRERLRTGLTVLVAGYGVEGPLAVGSHQPVGAVSEIAGVGTLPAARRRGLAAAVTSALVRDALGRGVDVEFLSAADEDVARVYRRLGFAPIATAMIAEPAVP